MSRFSEHERCEYCRFAKPVLKNTVACRRYPPQFAFEHEVPRHPGVFNDGWCGEFQWQKDAWNAVSAIAAEDMKKEKP